MTLRTTLYATAALAALCTPAYADDAAIEKRLDQMQHMIEAQQSQIEQQSGEIKTLKSALKKKGVHLEAVETVKTVQIQPVQEQVEQQQV
jgi:septal ring factor EnvC (AmiA/AmiB activator)